MPGMLPYGTFRKLGIPYSGVFYNKDPTIKGTILGSPIFGHEGVTENRGP